MALAAITAFFAVATVAWLHLDRAPPLWDEAHYLRESASLNDTLQARGPVAFLDAFSRTLGNKAPLITVLPLPLFHLFDESHRAARYVNVVFIVIASYYLFRLGDVLAGRRAALLAVVLLNTFPLVAGMTRQFLVEYGLMTLVIVWMYHLMRWRRGAEGSASWALGVLLGIGMLLKVTFPLYVAVPTVLVLAPEIRDPSRRRRALLAAARVAAVAVPIAGIWYFRNWKSILDFALSASYGEAAAGYSKGSVFSLSTIVAYWQHLISYGISVYGLVLLLVVACWIGAGALRREDRSGVRRDGLDVLLAWMVVPALLLTFAVSKEIRFTMPYLPAVALATSAGWVRMTDRRLRTAALWLIAVAALANYAYYTFGRGQLDLRVAGLVVLSSNVGWAHPPATSEWPNERLVRLIGEDAEASGPATPRVTLLFSHPALNAHNLNYIATLHHLAPRFRTVQFTSPEPASELAAGVLTESDYLLTKSGVLGSVALNVKNVEVLGILEGERMPFARIGSISLPDGTEVIVSRATADRLVVSRASNLLPTSSPGRPRPVRFGAGIVLVDSEVRVEEEGFHLRLTWQCVADLAEDYRVFVHLVDPEIGPYAAADHQPTDGRYPTSQWQVGDVIEQQRWVPLRLPEGHQVYVGVYGATLGSRLATEGADPAWTAEPNAARIH